MSNHAVLLECENRLETAMGAWFPGERVVLRGRDLLEDLAPKLSWMGLLLFGITGRIFDEKQIRLFEKIWEIGISYPDPRLWNNRVAALAGAARSTAALGIAAATAVTEAVTYGNRINIRAIEFLIRTKKDMDEGCPLSDLIEKELAAHRVIGGYGRPLVSSDERVAPTLKMAQKLGFGNGAYLKLAFRIEDMLKKSRYRMQMNMSGIGAALGADQGLTPEQYYQYLVLAFSGGMFPCYIDAKQKSEGTFFPTRCDRLAYAGVSPRKWSASGVCG